MVIFVLVGVLLRGRSGGLVMESCSENVSKMEGHYQALASRFSSKTCVKCDGTALSGTGKGVCMEKTCVKCDGTIRHRNAYQDENPES